MTKINLIAVSFGIFAMAANVLAVTGFSDVYLGRLEKSFLNSININAILKEPSVSEHMMPSYVNLLVDEFLIGMEEKSWADTLMLCNDAYCLTNLILKMTVSCKKNDLFREAYELGYQLVRLWREVGPYWGLSFYKQAIIFLYEEIIACLTRAIAVEVDFSVKKSLQQDLADISREVSDFSKAN